MVRWDAAGPAAPNVARGITLKSVQCACPGDHSVAEAEYVTDQPNGTDRNRRADGAAARKQCTRGSRCTKKKPGRGAPAQFSCSIIGLLAPSSSSGDVPCRGLRVNSSPPPARGANFTTTFLPIREKFYALGLLFLTNRFALTTTAGEARVSTVHAK